MNDANEKAASRPGDADDVAIDALLHAAMKARPEPALADDLAARAMLLARADGLKWHGLAAGAEGHADSSQLSRRLSRQIWWGQISGVIAALLIIAMFSGAVHRMWTRGDITAIATASSEDSSTDTTSTETTTAGTDSSSYSTTRTIAIVFVAELLVMGLVLMTISGRAPNMPLGAEVAGGFW